MADRHDTRIFLKCQREHRVAALKSGIISITRPSTSITLLISIIHFRSNGNSCWERYHALISLHFLWRHGAK